MLGRYRGERVERLRSVEEQRYCEYQQRVFVVVYVVFIVGTDEELDQSSASSDGRVLFEKRRSWGGFSRELFNRSNRESVFDDARNRERVFSDVWFAESVDGDMHGRRRSMHIRRKLRRGDLRDEHQRSAGGGNGRGRRKRRRTFTRRRKRRFRRRRPRRRRRS